MKRKSIFSLAMIIAALVVLFNCGDNAPAPAPEPDAGKCNAVTGVGSCPAGQKCYPISGCQGMEGQPTQPFSFVCPSVPAASYGTETTAWYKSRQAHNDWGFVDTTPSGVTPTGVVVDFFPGAFTSGCALPPGTHSGSDAWPGTDAIQDTARRHAAEGLISFRPCIPDPTGDGHYPLQPAAALCAVQFARHWALGDVCAGTGGTGSGVCADGTACTPGAAGACSGHGISNPKVYVVGTSSGGTDALWAAQMSTSACVSGFCADGMTSCTTASDCNGHGYGAVIQDSSCDYESEALVVPNAAFAWGGEVTDLSSLPAGPDTNIATTLMGFACATDAGACFRASPEGFLGAWNPYMGVSASISDPSGLAPQMWEFAAYAADAGAPYEIDPVDAGTDSLTMKGCAGEHANRLFACDQARCAWEQIRATY